MRAKFILNTGLNKIFYSLTFYTKIDFRATEVLIYVLDVKSDKPEGDMEGYVECLKVYKKK